MRSDLINEYLCYLMKRGAEEAESATPGAFSGMTSEGRTCEWEIDVIGRVFGDNLRGRLHSTNSKLVCFKFPKFFKIYSHPI